VQPIVLVYKNSAYLIQGVKRAMITQLRRRLQDGIISKNPMHKMNLDRRFKAKERRDLNYSDNYNGPSRRFIIDRRLTIHDRRCVEK